MSVEYKFIVDAMLGKLARWLRIMGCDALYFRGGDKAGLIRQALTEGRIILTRDTGLIARKNLPDYLFINSDYPEEQLREVSLRYPIASADKAFSRCSWCNVPIEPVSRENIQGKVPEYVFVHHTRFSHCPACGRIYWPGSHYKTMSERLEGIGGGEEGEESGKDE